MKIKKIGVWDSGIGGFSILNELLTSFYEHEYFYLADNVFSPYGEKSDQEIIKRGDHLIRLFIEQNVDLIVIACNTATAVSIDTYRKHYKIPFVGVEPYINVKNEANWNQNNKVAVITTTTTGNSERFRKLKKRLDPKNEITSHCCPNLAKHIEDFFETKNEDQLTSDIKKELAPLKDKYTHLILGCTHYPLISKQIEKALNVKTISPCKAVAKRVGSLLSIEASPETIKNKTINYWDTSIDTKWKTKHFYPL